jgi:alpha-mannosidase
VKQLALLLAGDNVSRPDLDPSLAPAIIAGFQALWHPHLLRDADTPPVVADIANPPEGEDRLFIIPASVFEAADPIVRRDLEKALGTKILLVKEETGKEGPYQLTQSLGLDAQDRLMLDEFFALGYAYLGMLVLLWHLDRSDRLDEHLVWAEVLQAVTAYGNNESEHVRDAIHAAYDVLHGNRQSAYPATINWVDIALARPTGNDSPLIDRLATDCRINLLMTESELASLNEEAKDSLKNGIANDHAEIIGGRATHRPWTLLPFESRLWEVARSSSQYKSLTDRELDTFGGRSASLSADLPQILTKFGFRYALHSAFDGSRFPKMRGPKIHWNAPDGSLLEALVRGPIDAGSETSGLTLFAQLARTLQNDRAATIVLAHWIDAPASWYETLLRIQRNVTVFGKFEKFSEYFIHATLHEGPTVTRAEEYGSPTAATAEPDGISRWRDLCVRRHRLETSRRLLSLSNVLGEELTTDTEPVEEAIERERDDAEASLQKLEPVAAAAITRAIMKDAAPGSGYLLVNPSSFPRRVGVELDGVPSLEIDQTVRAFERNGDKSSAIVDLQGWGWAWIPRGKGDAKTATDDLEPVAKGNRLKNTMIELEIDKRSGGIRGIWSLRDRYSRLGQQLAYSTGTKSVAKSVAITGSGKLYGEITSKGDILGSDGRTVVATFEQRVRLWRGRPVVRIDMRITPRQPLTGDPRENYIACRWGWPDDKTVVLGSSGPSMQSNNTEEIEATDFLELREQALATNIVTGGLVFHRRKTGRSLDTILVTPGESAQEFTMWVAIDSPDPFRLAQAEMQPIQVIPVETGPPKTGVTGAVAKLTGEGVLVNSMTPVLHPEPGMKLRVMETTGITTRAEIEWSHPPNSAHLANFKSEMIYDLYIDGKKISIDLSSLEWQQIDLTFKR